MDDRANLLTCACGHAFPPPAGPGEILCPKCGKSVPPPLRISKSKETPASVSPRKSQFAPTELPPANLVPGFVIQKRLGSGGMGDVYLARQESLDRQVAIKLLPPDLAKDKAYVETFLKEARSAAKVSHENIVGAVDAGEAGGRYFFVMEQVEGETLFKILRTKGFLPEPRALDVARQVASGLRHAHKHGLVHRDIKPQNIMITPEGKAKILDFGLARDVSKEKAQQSEMVHSTPAYASPEQCRGEAAVDHRSDMYSLGIMLFELLTGKRPFQADTVRRLMNKQVQEAPPEPRAVKPGISESANAIILRLLRKQPAERFQSYDELIAAIDAAAPGSRADAAPPMKKLPLPLLAGGAAAAVLVVVLALVFRGGGKPVEPPVDPTPARAAEDPEAERVLRETRELQRRAEGRPAEYAAIRMRWRELESRYRGTPQHPKFSSALAEFDALIVKEADSIAASVLAEADKHAKAGRFNEALAALAKFPESLSHTESNTRVAAKVLEVERGLDARYREGVAECQAQLLAGRFDEARGRLHLLRLSLAVNDEVRPAYRDELEKLRARIDEAQLAAAKKPETPPKPVETPAPPPPPTPAETPAAKTPKPKVPEAALAHLETLHAQPMRVPPDRRAAAAAFFAGGAKKSPLFRAAAIFLSREEAAWKLEGAAAKVFDEHVAAVVGPETEAFTPEIHLAALAALAGKVAALGPVPLDALHLFAAAHLDAVAAGKGKVEPAVAMQLKLGKAPVSDVWGPPSSVARIEMASLLVAGPALWIAKASELAVPGPDFAAKYLGALCHAKDEACDLAKAQARWKKLAAEAPDPAWTRMCETVAERFKLAATCEGCLGQGRYSCPYCSASGIGLCATCAGTGSMADPMDGGKVTCSTCKGKKGAACAGCGGTKGLKCAVCDGKKTRTTAPAGFSRPILDLGLCEACGGTGSLFENAAYPCGACEGNGRRMDRVTKEFLKLPLWLKSREGRGLFGALRWLARHRSADGSWGVNAWSGACGACKPFDTTGLSNVGVTSLGLVAFLNAGFGPESDVLVGGVQAGEVVKGAVAWLLAQQKPDGSIAQGKSIKPVYEHLVATYALYVAAQQSPESPERAALREAALRALRQVIGSQTKGAGWGYLPQAASDTWVTAWGGLALLSAREAGIEVPRVNLGYIIAWFDSVTDKKDLHVGYTPTLMGKVNLTGYETFEHHPTLSAFAGLVRVLIEGKATASVAAADRALLLDLPNPAPAERDYSYWNIGTMFLLQREQRKGTAWTHWSNAVVREALAAQETAEGCGQGSWTVEERWSPMGGKVYATAINALTLGHVAGTRPPAAKR